MTEIRLKPEKGTQRRERQSRVSEPRRRACTLPMGELEIEFEFEIPHVEGHA